jgi:hypothetical protein
MSRNTTPRTRRLAIPTATDAAVKRPSSRSGAWDACEGHRREQRGDGYLPARDHAVVGEHQKGQDGPGDPQDEDEEGGQRPPCRPSVEARLRGAERAARWRMRRLERLSRQASRLWILARATRELRERSESGSGDGVPVVSMTETEALAKIRYIISDNSIPLPRTLTLIRQVLADVEPGIPPEQAEQ